MVIIYDDHLGVIWESSGSHLGVIWETFGSHLGSIWEPFRHPGGTRRHPGGQGHLGVRMCHIICACAQKWCGWPLSRARERRDHHRLTRLRTRLRRRVGVKSRVTIIPFRRYTARTPTAETVWGITRKFDGKICPSVVQIHPRRPNGHQQYIKGVVLQVSQTTLGEKICASGPLREQ